MRKNTFFAIIAFVTSTLSLQAQNLAGFWRMENYQDASVPVSYLKIMPQEYSAVKALYIYDGKEITLDGSKFDDNTLILIENNENRYTFNGNINSDNTITGNFYRGEENPSYFTWTKVCDDLGSSIDGSGVSCIEKTKSAAVVTGYRTETRMVKKMVQVAEKGVYSTELRNENIPLAETVTEIPENAIIVGHIGLDETVTYKTVEMEVAEEVQVPINEVTSYEQTSTKKAIKKKEVAQTAAPTPKAKPTVKIRTELLENSKIQNSENFTNASSPKKDVLTAKGDVPKSYDASTYVPFNTCDIGATSPSEHISKMTKGTTINEAGHTYHIVGKGETMTAICKMYGISIPDLADKNKKICERINIGEKLLIK